MAAVTVLDASAVLAFLFDEPGAEIVGPVLPVARIGAANWAEVMVKAGSESEQMATGALLVGMGLTIDDVTRADAERAAAIHASSPWMSLGDRLCLALAERLDADVLTSDKAWGTDGRVRQIR